MLVLEARGRLALFAIGRSLEEVLIAILDEAERLTGSRIGFFHFVEADQRRLSLQAWSTNTTQGICEAEGLGRHYDLEEAGVWADCVRLGKPVIYNDYGHLQGRRGLPAGHAPVTRLISVPIRRGEGVVAVIGLGNKDEDYRPVDVELLHDLADLGWDLAEKKRGEEALSEACRRIEALYRELQHRIKNSFALITSLLTLDAADGAGPACREHIQRLSNRVLSIAGLYDLLRQSARDTEVELGSYLGGIVEAVRAGFLSPGRDVDIETSLEGMMVEADIAAAVGLVANELLTNCLKYAFPDGRKGKVEIGLSRQGGEVVLSVSDNGVGLPEGFAPGEGNGLGLRLAGLLADQHGGRLEWLGEGRRRVELVLPLPAATSSSPSPT
jgi:two-component sensor histidine kinase